MRLAQVFAGLLHCVRNDGGQRGVTDGGISMTGGEVRHDGWGVMADVGR